MRPTPVNKVEGARAIPNIRLTCDWCGNVPATLYLPYKHVGVFCEGCIGGVLNPPPPAPPQIDDRGDYTLILKKLNAFLKDRPAEPAFCGRGAPRKGRLPAQSCPQRIEHSDRARVVSRAIEFSGMRSQLWHIVCRLDGASIGEVLGAARKAGIANTNDVLMASLRRLAVTYGVLAIDRRTA